MTDWKNLQYLQAGTARQRRAYDVLQQSGLWPLLREFDPVLVGTIPLGIDTATSDLDVLCEVPPSAQPGFAQLLRAHFGAWPGFRLAQRAIGGYPTTVSSFRFQTEELELFGQALPTAQQQGFRHLLIEHAVLEAGGQAWRIAVRALKQQGLKTEPAFAKLLHLPGDPYEALLALEGKTAAGLRHQLPPLPAA